jgi:glycosyltransferase involved in cell wall biosynthesis
LLSGKARFFLNVSFFLFEINYEALKNLMEMVTQICISRFHHFHLARQLERYGLLKEIWTGYPRAQLKDESGIPTQKIKNFPWLHAPFMLASRHGLEKIGLLHREWAWRAIETLDRHVARQLKQPTSVVAISGCGLYTGRKAQASGGRFVCDRGSSHIRYQDRILREEYQRWGKAFNGVDARTLAKEEAEYAQADAVTVPSEFVRRSFLNEGVPASKVIKIPYGARLDRFQKQGEPPQACFRILWTGNVSIRKGFMYLLQAFQNFSHPNKELVVIGAMHPDLSGLLADQQLAGVKFVGTVSNQQLAGYYSRAHVFVLPSIEEGLSMVMGEALACGCPVIATTNTGAEDLFTNGVEGFIIPIRSSPAILEKLELLAQDPGLRERMSAAALDRVRLIGGWNAYGDKYANFLNELTLGAT